MLGPVVDETVDEEFLYECFTVKGGFAKYQWLKDKPDFLHNFYSLCALSMSQ